MRQTWAWQMYIAIGVTFGIIFFLFYYFRRYQQGVFIDNYRFHNLINKKLIEHYPHLTQNDTYTVIRALKEYFHLCRLSKRRLVAMPSQVVDVAWHEFILMTRPYHSFCKKAFGRFLHHQPAEAMKSRNLAQDGLKRAWRLACAREKIDPQEPRGLPLLFSIDKKLNIENGFHYSPNCTLSKGNDYCAAAIGCASGCVGDSGNGDSGDGFFGGDSSCGGGCGGD